LRGAAESEADVIMRKGYADTQLGQFHYAEAGQGPGLVLFGPAPRSWRVFAGLIPLLAERWRVLVVEQPGFGESAPQSAAAPIETIADAMAEAVVLTSFSGAAVFGLHSGAKLGAALAARHPALVGQLVLCGKSHSIAPDREIRNRATRAAVERQYFIDGAGRSSGGDRRREWAAQGRNLASLWWSDRLLSPEAAPALFDAAAAKIADGLTARATVLDAYDANFAFDFAAAVRAVRCPLTVMEITSTEEDATIGRQGAALAALAGQASVLALPDIDPGGLDLHAGTARLATAILQALGQGAPPGREN
jgi:pimeloyl-ACP methyl ester carboxylesterase